MATPARRLIQDQNLSFLYNGTTPGGKIDVSKADKKGGLGGRKALNDISNSTKPSSAFRSVKKDNSINVISIDTNPSAAKGKSSKAPEKGKVGSRKALTDLTNSVKPHPRRKLSAIAEDNVSSCIAEEGFLHNHVECIKAQTTAMEKDYFLKSVGLNKPEKKAPLLSSSKKMESNIKHSKMEELVLEDTECRKSELCSPACRSPQSPKAPYMSCWEGDNLSDLMVIQTPLFK